MVLGYRRESQIEEAARSPGPDRSVFLPQQRMEQIAIERVLAAKRSLENRPCGGEAQVVPGAGRSLSKFMSHPRAQPQRLCGALEARKTRRILVGRAPITAKQFVDDLKAAFS